MSKIEEQLEVFDTRYTMPTKYDIAPFGTLCQVVGDGGEIYHVLIQISHDEKRANWMPVGQFFERIFSPIINNSSFIKECLNLFEINKGDYQKIATVLLKDSLDNINT